MVTVRNHGTGWPEELLRDGPQRFRTGAAERGRGHGLGLTIAEGHAGVLEASLEYARAPGGGALAVLRLPRGRCRPGTDHPSPNCRRGEAGPVGAAPGRPGRPAGFRAPRARGGPGLPAGPPGRRPGRTTAGSCPVHPLTSSCR
ncbi:ATP-binding protein [Streptomyces sp. NPDC001380]|uniref:ATP-binding protein n=1 Tax=Streptomyces sp. NPDC001380 TaxID=3364566 RepID=UPI0036BEB999